MDPLAAKDACRSIDDHASLLHMSNIDDSSVALSQMLGKWRIQGQNENLCWVDSDGNEIEHPELVFPSDENNTLVLDVAANEIGETLANTSLGYICQMENNGGKQFVIYEIFVLQN